jgi:hypothetical protein
MRSLRALLALALLVCLPIPATPQGFYSLPATTIGIFADPTEGLVPLKVTFLLSVTHDGRLPKYVAKIDCKNGEPIVETPETSGQSVIQTQSLYVFAEGCTYETPGIYIPDIDVYKLTPDGLKHVAHMGYPNLNAPVINATSTVSLPQITTASFAGASLARPASGQTINATVAGGRANYVWRADLNDNCGAIGNCQDPCFETLLGVTTGGSLVAAALPDFPNLGTQSVNVCVYDSSPTPVSDVERIVFDVIEQHIEVELEATPAAFVGATLDNVALEATVTGDATGIGVAPGCRYKFCGTENCAAGATESVLYSNDFTNCSAATATTGVFTCPVTPSVTGPQGGTVAQVGATPGGTNLIRFGAKYTSALDQIIEFSMRITTEGTSNSQALLRTRYGASAGSILIQRANATNNSLAISRNSAVCNTSANNAYTVGTWATYSLHLNTDTGAVDLFKDGGAVPIASCAGAAGDFPADGFELIVGNGVAEFDHVEISEITAGGAGVYEIAGSTDNPFDTATDGPTPTLFDGYTTGTTRAKVEVTCGTAPTKSAFADISVQPDVTLTATVTPQVTVPCIAGACSLIDATVDFGGTATGAVTDFELEQVGTGVIFADATASDPYALVADGAFEPIGFSEPGTIQFRARATRQAKPVEQPFQVVVQDPVVLVPDLEAEPPAIQASTPPGTNAATRCIDMTDALGGALPFTCTESSAWLSITGGSGTTPAQVCVVFANVAANLAAGTHNTTVQCEQTGKPTDEADIAVQILIQNPAGPTPWMDGRNGSGQPLVDMGTPDAPSVATFVKEVKLPDQGRLTDKVGAGATGNYIIHNSTFDELRGRGDSAVCFPEAGCGSDGGERDALHVPWGNAFRSVILFMKNVTAQNAWFTNEGCTAGGCSPHADALQAWPQNGTAATHLTIQDSIFENSDSGQQFHGTDFTALQTFALHNVIMRQTSAFVTACLTRSSLAGAQGWYQGLRSCSKLHGQLPRAETVWLIGGQGTVKGGQPGNPTTTPRFVRIQFDASRFTQVFTAPGAVVVDYANIEAAIAAETAAGKQIPKGLKKSCAGWASPPANCTPVGNVGDQD